jgi:ATP-dependent DNA helicase DinG
MISLNEGGGPVASRAAELTAAVFSEGGWLGALAGVEHRPEQERMAARVATAMEAAECLLCEAGTGVGKSLAYLIPGIIHAVDTRRQFLVSTHTKTLQEQVRDKDLQRCRELFRATPELAEYAGFASAVLMGKGNYLCTTRLARALADKQELFTTPLQAELLRVAQWAEQTKTGLLTDLQPRLADDVWEAVSADSEACSKKNCADGRCFYRKAKAACDAAQVLIVNHSLLFTLMAMQGATGQVPASGVLRLGDFAVLDEAHTVPDIATDHLGLSLSHTGLRRLLHSLYNPERMRGLLHKHRANTACFAVQTALDQAEHFFALLQERVLQKENIVRLRTGGGVEHMLDSPLNKVLAELDRLATAMDAGPAKDELEGKARRVSAYRNGLAAWIDQQRSGDVHWLEATTSRRFPNVLLRSAPLDVSAELRRRLFARETSVVLTSATLATGSTIEPFRQRVGAEGVDVLIEKSPFDYERNMRVYLAADIPEPAGAESRLNLDAITDYIRFCTLQVKGGSLVLFTSYRDLLAVAAKLEPEYREAGRPCLIQETGASRSALAGRLREAGNAVLFGTESFWTGIDVPGAALSQVIITRLPFEPPTHPVAQARAEWVESEGGNPFAQISLPDALGKFRQGVGRLIRSKTDQGVVTILDPRVLTKAYGREFVASLPTLHFRKMTRADRGTIFHPFP